MQIPSKSRSTHAICALLAIIPVVPWIAAQVHAQTKPDASTIQSASQSRERLDGARVLKLDPNPLIDVIQQIEGNLHELSDMANELGVTSRMPNLILDDDAATAVVSRPLIVRDATPLRAVVLAATAAGCYLEEIADPERVEWEGFAYWVRRNPQANAKAESGKEPLLASGNQTFEWDQRLLVSREQLSLLRLYGILERLPEKLPTPKLLEQITRNLNEVSSMRIGRTLRPADPGELLVRYADDDTLATIYNPSSDDLAFTIAIRGETKPLGSMEGSAGNLVYLPAKSALRVPGLHWTSPRMSNKD